jgi:2-polyprenyl-3-methyl-5-hydroxy-6-metoxy-1,4-benzoquinol methylase
METNKMDFEKRKSLADPELLSKMIELVCPPENCNVLDVGCGLDANTAIAFAKQGHQVIAIDADAKTIEEAKKAVAKAKVNIDFAVVSVKDKLPYSDEAFAVVTCRAALHHFPSKKDFFSEVRRILKGGGILYIMDPVVSPDLHTVWMILSRLGESDHYSYATYDEMMSLFVDSGFTIQGMRPFLFERKLDGWINSKIKDENDKGEISAGPYVLYARNKMREIITGFMDQKLRDELRFENRGTETQPDWWFYYNCLEIAAKKVAR